MGLNPLPLFPGIFEGSEVMLEVSVFEDVTCIKMSQTMGGKPLSWVACYLVDGLLVDTGPAHVSEELMRFLENNKVQKVVNTHHHEDQAGGDGPLQRELGLPVSAPAEAIPILVRFPR